jgi:hypothetical protein
MNDQRKHLIAAQDALRNAEANFKGAREAVARAAAFVEDAEKAAKKHCDFAKGVTLAQAAAMREAIKTGKTPLIEVAPKMVENAKARLEAEARLEAAKTAFADLSAEEKAAEAAHEDAKGRVSRAIDATILAEAEERAARIETLAGELLHLRAQLGGSLSFIAVKLGRKLPARLAATLMEIDRTEVGIKNTPANMAARAAASVWEKFALDLKGDANAELRFV